MERMLARMDAIHGRLLDAVSSLDAEQFSQKPSENQWSVAEVVHHLCLVEQAVFKEMERRAAADESQKAPFLQRLIPMRLLVGTRTARIKAPKFVEPVNPPPKETVIAEYERVRHDLKEFAHQMGRHGLLKLTVKHPVFKKLDGVRAISFIANHERRHFKQIQEIIRKREGV